MKHLSLGIISILSWSLFGTVVAAQQAPPPDNLLAEISWNCSEFDFTVWGRDEDLRLSPGQTGWTWVAEGTINYFCGEWEGSIECPGNTDFIWVKRTAKWALFVYCYDNS